MSSGVEFDDDNFGQTRSQFQGGQNYYKGIQNNYSGEERGMIGWLIRKNIVKSSKGAEAILIVFSILNLIIMFLFFYF